MAGNKIASLVFAAAMAVCPLMAEVVVRVGPPPVVVERREGRPSHAHVWVSGYHRWDGNAYSWQAGRWEEPPRAHAVWVAPRYTHRHDGYVYTEGRWR